MRVQKGREKSFYVLVSFEYVAKKQLSLSMVGFILGSL